MQQCLPFTVLKRIEDFYAKDIKYTMLQQCLPFTVLKQSISFKLEVSYPHKVATVLTVYGIETSRISLTVLNAGTVATVLTVYGIETLLKTRLSTH